MLTRRTIEAAASATLEFLSDRFDARPAEIAAQAAAEEAFADVAVYQLLRMTGDGMRARSAWAGYQGTSVARQLLEAFDENWNRWEPAMSLVVADAAVAIAQRSDRATPALLFSVHKERANALRVLNLYEEAFQALDTVEEIADDTRNPRLHHAIVANARSATFAEMSDYARALPLLFQAREGFLSCGETWRVEQTREAEGILYCDDRCEDAVRLMEHALAGAEAARDEKAVALYLANLTMGFVRLGDNQMARRCLARADAMARALRWTVIRANLLSAKAYLDIREYGLDGCDSAERAFAEFERLGRLGDRAFIQLQVVDEILKVDPSADVRHLCQDAYTGALAHGVMRVAERALQILERNSIPAPPCA